jgi:hypothetical protein
LRITGSRLPISAQPNLPRASTAIINMSGRTRKPRATALPAGSPPKIRFAADSPLEGSGFELSVPPGRGELTSVRN